MPGRASRRRPRTPVLTRSFAQNPSGSPGPSAGGRRGAPLPGLRCGSHPPRPCHPQCHFIHASYLRGTTRNHLGQLFSLPPAGVLPVFPRPPTRTAAPCSARGLSHSSGVPRRGVLSPPATGRHTSGAGRLLTQARKPLAASPPAVKRGLAPGSGRTWQRASGSRESRSRCRNSAGARAAGTLDDGMNKHTCEPVRGKRGGWRGSGRTRGGEDSRPSTFGRPGRLCRAVTSE